MGLQKAIVTSLNEIKTYHRIVAASVEIGGAITIFGGAYSDKNMRDSGGAPWAVPVTIPASALGDIGDQIAALLYQAWKLSDEYAEAEDVIEADGEINASTVLMKEKAI